MSLNVNSPGVNYLMTFRSATLDPEDGQRSLPTRHKKFILDNCCSKFAESDCGRLPGTSENLHTVKQIQTGY